MIRTMLTAPLALLALVGLTTVARADEDYSEGRPKEAVELCVEQAEQVLENRGRDASVEVDEIDSIEEDGDHMKIMGRVVSEGSQGRRTERKLDCDVNWDESDDARLTYFNEAAFLDTDDDRGQGGRAREACERAARQDDFRVTDIGERERTERGVRFEMRLTRNENRFRANCFFNENRDQAELRDIDRAGN